MQPLTRNLLVIGSLLAACSGNVERNDTVVNPNPIGGDGEPDVTDGDGESDEEEDGASNDGDGQSEEDPQLDAGTEPGDGDGDDDGDVGGDGAPTDGEPEDPDETDPCGEGGEALTTGLRIRELSLYQTVKIPLLESGAWRTTRNAPVVQGKDALLRVFVDTLAGFQSHSVRGVLTLDNGGVKKQLTADLRPTGASTDAAKASTFNFEIPGADIQASTRFSVALVETTCPASIGSASDARYPQSDLQALGAERVGGLNVVIVPVVVGGRAPDTSAAQLEAMRSFLLAYYPVPSVTITLRQAINANTSVGASGQGWSDVLDQVMNARYSDRPADDVYYYGIMAPSSSFNSYCAGGCVLGLAPQTVRVDPDQQAGLGVGFLNEFTPDTMVHELGHAHGRGHAPCAEGGGIQGVDSRFPYDEGDIGVWGYDSRDKSLVTPTTKDIMGYCSPTWISDYTYDALATRSQAVNTAARVSLPVGKPWQGFLLYADGTARETAQRPVRMPAGEVEFAEAYDAGGKLVAKPEVVRLKLSHVDDEFLYVQEPDASWSELVVSGRRLQMADVQRAD